MEDSFAPDCSTKYAQFHSMNMHKLLDIYAVYMLN